MHYRQITYEFTLISSHHYKNSSVIVDLAMGQISYHIPQNVFLVEQSAYDSTSYVDLLGSLTNVLITMNSFSRKLFVPHAVADQAVALSPLNDVM